MGIVIGPSDNPEIPAGRQFQRVAPLAAPRMAFGYTPFKGRIYVFGGLGGPTWDTATDSIEVYDPLSDTWTVEGLLPKPIYGQAAAVLENKIILVGGQTGGTAGCAPLDSAEILAYDPAVHRVDFVGNLSEGRWGAALLPLDSGLLVAGGVKGPFRTQFSRLFEPRSEASTDPTTGCTSGGNTAGGQIQVLAGTILMTAASMPDFHPLAAGRALAGQGTLNGIPFLTLGWVQGSEHPTVDNRSTSLDRPNKQWTGSVPPNMDGTWGPASAQASKDAFVVVGGIHPGFPSDTTIGSIGRQEVRLISASPARSLEGNFRSLPTLPEGVGLAGAAVLNDKLYVFGGLKGARANAVVTPETLVLRDLTPPDQGAPLPAVSASPRDTFR